MDSPAANFLRDFAEGIHWLTTVSSSVDYDFKLNRLSFNLPPDPSLRVFLADHYPTLMVVFECDLYGNQIVRVPVYSNLVSFFTANQMVVRRLSSSLHQFFYP